MARRGLNPDGSAHIRRPPNAFMLFRTDWSSHHRKKLGLKNGEVSQATGEIWGRMTLHEKAIWESLAEKAKVAHALRYPDYVYKPKQPTKKPEKGKKGAKEERAQEPPRKRRRMGEPSINTTLGMPPTREPNANPTPSPAPQEEAPTPAGPPPTNPAPEIPPDVGQADYAPSSFATHDQPFTFCVPHIPVDPDFQYGYQASATVDGDPNTVHFNGDYAWPTSDICLSHQAAATVDNYLNAFHSDDDYEWTSARFNVAHQTNATRFNDANTYRLSADYEWPATGHFVPNFEQFREFSNTGNDGYSGGEAQERVFDDGAQFTSAIASVYTQNAYVTTEASNEYYGS